MDNREPTRTRERGTRVTQATTPAERVAAFRRIVEQKQYAKIDGTMIDLFSAGVTVQVYDALNDENKAKLSALPAGRMALIAFKVVNAQK